MKSRLFFWSSVALNFVLLVAVSHFAFRQPESKPVLREVRVAPASESVAITATETNSESGMSEPVAEGFSWAQLVSTDFKVYRDRLRSIGCPEETVRDIIIAEIDELFRPRRAEIVAGVQKRYWEMAAKGKKAFEEVEAALEKVGEEHQALIQEVLGKDAEDEELDRERQTRSWERRYAWLPAEKRTSLVDLELEFQKRTQAIWEEVGKRANPETLPQDQEKINALEEELAAARKRLMSPEELLEFRLRNSTGRSWARIPGFEATETEWRAVAQLKLEYEEALQKTFPNPSKMNGAFALRYGLPAPNGPEEAARGDLRRLMEAELNSAMKSALGAERFAEYQLAANSDYQQTKRIIDRYELPESLAKQAYELQRTAAAHAEAVGADPSLSDEARLSALAAIRQETERALATTLGSKVFSTYQEYHGDWLQRLDQTTER